MGRDRLLVLDALRGLAAIGVVLFHMKGHLFSSNLFSGGYLAVDLFFVLSGYVIAYIYDTKINNSLSVRGFIIARAARFAPLLFVAVGLGASRAVLAMVVHSNGALSWGQLIYVVISNMLLVPAPLGIDSDLFVLNVPLWTLSFEFFVNVLYAIFHKRLSTKVLIFVAVASISAMVSYNVAFGSNDLGSRVITAGGGAARALFGFSAGVIICRYNIKAPKIPTSIILFVLAAIMVSPLPAAMRVPFDLFFALILSPVLVAIAAPQQVGLFWGRIAEELGAMSFALYAIHQPIIALWARLTDKIHAPPLVLSAALLVLLILAAAIVERYYDQPVRGGLSRRLRQHS